MGGDGVGGRSHVVIPAEAGIHLLLFLIVSALSRNPTHVPVSFPRIPARESLSLACARESNQREHTLAAAVAGAPAPATSRGRCGGSLTGHPWPDSERARIVRAPLTGFFLRALAAAEREPGRSRARPSWPQKPKRSETAKARNPTLVIPAKAGIHLPVALAFDVGPCGAAKGGRIRPAPRAGRREGSRRFCRRPGWPVGKTPAARSEPARSAGASPGCPSLGYFSWASKRSDPAARMAGGITQGRESVFAKRRNSKTKQMDSGFRRNDGVRGFRRNEKKGTGSRPSPGRRSGRLPPE